MQAASRDAGADLHDRLRRAEATTRPRTPGGGAAPAAPTTPSSTSTPDDAWTVMPALPAIYDEPFADSVADPDRSWSRGSPAARSRSRCRATAATSCSAATTAIAADLRIVALLRALARRRAPGAPRRRSRPRGDRFAGSQWLSKARPTLAASRGLGEHGRRRSASAVRSASCSPASTAPARLVLGARPVPHAACRPATAGRSSPTRCTR